MWLFNYFLDQFPDYVLNYLGHAQWFLHLLDKLGVILQKWNVHLQSPLTICDHMTNSQHWIIISMFYNTLTSWQTKTYAPNLLKWEMTSITCALSWYIHSLASNSRKFSKFEFLGSPNIIMSIIPFIPTCIPFFIIWLKYYKNSKCISGIFANKFRNTSLQLN